MYKLLNRLMDRFGIILSSMILTVGIVLLSEAVTIAYAALIGTHVSNTALILATLVPSVLCPPVYYVILSMLTKLRRSERERGQVIEELELALAGVKQLSGMLPICSHCKKIRDDEGYWKQIEVYIATHSEMLFSHGICPDCAKKYYSDILD